MSEFTDQEHITNLIAINKRLVADVKQAARHTLQLHNHCSGLRDENARLRTRLEAAAETLAHEIALGEIIIALRDQNIGLKAENAKLKQNVKNILS